MSHRAHGLAIAIVLACVSTLPGQEPPKKTYRHVFISVGSNMNTSTNMNILSNQSSREAVLGRYVTPECPTNWSVRRWSFVGGKQQGVDIIWVNNGLLEVALIPTRGMGIHAVYVNQARILGWDSPVKEIVNPNFINLQSRGGLGWLEGFNEWLCRCGLEWNGQPGPDKFVTNTGAEATMDLTLHGRIANLPAQEVELIALREPPFTLTIRANVHERMMLGPKLELTTEFVTTPNSRSFRINDAVTNRGAQRQEFQMLYHLNFGAPLLAEGSRFLAPVESVTPFNDEAAKGVKQYDQYAGPRAGAIEQVYTLKPLADHGGMTTVMLRNKAGDIATSMRYNTHELPYLTLWKNLAAAEDGYVTGIEPGTNYPNHRSVERKAGRVPTLSPGESHFMAIDFTIHAGKDEVAQAEQQIAKIQGDRRPLINDRPEKKD